MPSAEGFTLVAGAAGSAALAGAIGHAAYSSAGGGAAGAAGTAGSAGAAAGTAGAGTTAAAGTAGAAGVGAAGAAGAAGVAGTAGGLGLGAITAITGAVGLVAATAVGGAVMIGGSSDQTGPDSPPSGVASGDDGSDPETGQGPEQSPSGAPSSPSESSETSATSTSDTSSTSAAQGTSTSGSMSPSSGNATPNTRDNRYSVLPPSYFDSATPVAPEVPGSPQDGSGNGTVEGEHAPVEVPADQLAGAVDGDMAIDDRTPSSSTSTSREKDRPSFCVFESGERICGSTTVTSTSTAASSVREPSTAQSTLVTTTSSTAAPTTSATSLPTTSKQGGVDSSQSPTTDSTADDVDGATRTRSSEEPRGEWTTTTADAHAAEGHASGAQRAAPDDAETIVPTAHSAPDADDSADHDAGSADASPGYSGAAEKTAAAKPNRGAAATPHVEARRGRRPFGRGADRRDVGA